MFTEEYATKEDRDAAESEFGRWLVQWYNDRHRVTCAGCGVDIPPGEAFDRRGCVVRDRCASCALPPVPLDDPAVQFMARALDIKS